MCLEMIDNFIDFVYRYFEIKIPATTTLASLRKIDEVIRILYHVDCSASEIEKMRSSIQSILDKQ